jgi:hypothetical protein
MSPTAYLVYLITSKNGETLGLIERIDFAPFPKS